MEQHRTYIRDRKEMRTGYQEIAPWAPELDLQCDFVMVYGLDDTLRERIAEFSSHGYEVCLMTGCAWGRYDDYLNGTWDGTEHWDERQTDRQGNPVLHGVDTPYMVPTEQFAEYLAGQLKTLADEGIAAIYMEEPEFWEAGGYSTAFQHEYEAYYHQPWEAPHTSIHAAYRCARLKSYLYGRLIAYLSAEVKTYARTHCGREIGFYVATHSLLNYTQWKILSPESRLTSFENVDGFIAQVWTGTAATGNVYEGHYKSRTFETAYLEYGIMQEMVRQNGKKMWFLHDPVEDFPEHTWEDYRKKYRKTLAASLFWPSVDRYEVCPWPNRVFNGRYPKKAGLADGMIPTTDMEGAKDIPKEYASMLSGMIQTLGNMNQKDYCFLGNEIPVGVLMSDTSLYQRSFPDQMQVEDCTYDMRGMEQAVNEQILSLRGTQQETEWYRNLTGREWYAYIESCAYPSFFGLTMPLLKYGLPVHPVYFELTADQASYLDAYRYLIVSYDYMKPERAEYQNCLVDWVKQGGCLIYVGDGSDPYHAAEGWWNETDPAKRADVSLFESLGIAQACANDGKSESCGSVYPVGKGCVAVWNKMPALLSTDRAVAGEYRNFVKKILADTGYVWKETNSLVMERGPYRIISVLDESCSDAPYRTEGLFTDLCADGFPVIKRAEVACGEEGLLFDYRKIEKETCCVVATAARIERFECEEASFTVWEKAADRISVHTRLRLPWKPQRVSAEEENGVKIPVRMEWDEDSRTALLSYESRNNLVKIVGQK